MADEDCCWEAWEPEEWLAARGACDGMESTLFVVRWGGASPFPEADALTLLSWLEAAWSLLCAPSSHAWFVTPYTTPGWSADGRRRKLNAYVSGTGLADSPHDAAWAHQGTHVQQGVAAVAHPRGNPRARLHHSYLVLAPDATRNECTVVHELTHALQMHTGGFVDSRCVGFAWEAHAEYCVHLYPRDPAWAHGVDTFLRTAHLPPGATRSAPDGPDGRQYVVWPWLAWVDRRWGPGAAHRLWHDDFRSRCGDGNGVSRDAVTTLAARLGGWAALGAAMGDYAAAVATAHFGCDAAADAAVRASCDVLAPARLAKLRRGDTADAWRSDARMPLKQHGVCVHRLVLPSGTGAASVRVTARPAADTPPAALHYVLVSYEAATGARVATAVSSCGDDDDGLAFPEVPDASALAWLLAVTAAPTTPVEVFWGIEPDALPTFAYAVQLAGCEPHVDSQPPPPPPPPPLLHAPAAGTADVAVPSGLGNLEPCALAPGAASTGADLRSGEPGATTVVWLRHALAPAPDAPGGARLLRVRFAYRVVVGYSGNQNDPGPRVELVARTELDGDGDADAAAADAALHVLFASAPFPARPWHYDASLGGAPDNYCPPQHVDAPCDVHLRAGQRLRLGLRFVNGARNVHLTGESRAAPPCDLQLRATLAAGCQ